MSGDPAQLHLLMALAIFAGAVVSGFCGFAFSAVAGAVLLHALPPREAVPLMMICSILVQGACLISLRRHIEWRGSLMLVAGGLFGLPPALYVLLHANPDSFRIGFGLFLAAYACVMLFRPALHYFRAAQGPGYDAAVGLMGGLVGGVTAMPGAIPTIWYDLRGLAKDRQRGLVQPYIASMQIAALAILAARHGVPDALIGDLLVSLAPLAVGTLVGLALFGRVSDGPFRRILLGVLLISGLVYVI
jgi:uncharacterized membrane protein YfcA